ncbi:MAG: extracellular solute-binding protein [Armatimonadota bacterium]
MCMAFAIAEAGVRSSELRRELIIFHAGSLSVPFKEVSAAFSRKHTGVVVKAEAAGSRDSARKISDLGRPCDVFASADLNVITDLLMPGFADFSIGFAQNEMAIAYTAKSTFADRINARNWHDVLQRSGVTFGRADPNRDPCGYRTMMLFQLAEKYYKKPGLAKRLAERGGARYIRPKETDLLALLESGEIDYLFIYRSVIEQHRLKMVRLPDQINLSSPKYSEFYRRARVTVPGRMPGETTVLRGAPIVYGVTIPRNARNRKLAESWVAFLLSPEGRRIIDRHGQKALSPAPVDNYDRLPASLRRYCVKR